VGIVTNVGKAYLKAQASGWGTAETSFAGADNISCKPILPQLVQEALIAQTFRGGWHALPIEPGSLEGATLQIEHVLQGTSLTTPVGNPTDSPDSLCLKSVLGSRAGYGYTDTQLYATGQTVNNVKFANAAITSAIAGMAMLVPVVGGGRDVVWAKTFTDGAQEDVVPWLQMTAAADPAGTPKTYGGLVHWLSMVQPDPFTAQIELQSDACVRFRDCVCVGSKLMIVAGQQPVITHSLRAGFWSPQTAGATAFYANTYPELPAVFGANGANFRYNGNGQAFPSVEIEFANTVIPSRSIGAADGFRKWITTEREVKVTITELLEINEYVSQLYALGEELGAVQVDMCTTPGRGASVFLPNRQVAEMAKDEDASGIVVRKTVHKARFETTETAGANAAGSVARIALF